MALPSNIQIDEQKRTQRALPQQDSPPQAIKNVFLNRQSRSPLLSSGQCPTPTHKENEIFSLSSAEKKHFFSCYSFLKRCISYWNLSPEKKSVSNCHSKNFIYICKSSCILVWNLSFFTFLRLIIRCHKKFVSLPVKHNIEKKYLILIIF